MSYSRWKVAEKQNRTCAIANLRHCCIFLSVSLTLFTNSWFAMTSSKIWINDFLDKALNNVNNLILEVSGRYTKKMQKLWLLKVLKISIHFIVAAMLVGKRTQFSLV